MKILAAYPSATANREPGMKVLVWPDSAMIRSGKPVFLPDDSARFVCLGFAARITAVGKTIMPRFAGRYYNEIAPMAFVMKEEAAQKLNEAHDPAAPDIVADYSLICGEFISADSESLQAAATEITLTPLSDIMNTTTEADILLLENIIGQIDDSLSVASKENTLKTGDMAGFIVPRFYKAVPETVLKVKIGQRQLIENKFK